MATRIFMELLQGRLDQGLHICVGLDPDYGHAEFPPHLKNKDEDPTHAMYDLCNGIINHTKDLVAAYKPNYAFYARYGSRGIHILKQVVEKIHGSAPRVPVILDAKWGDIDNTNKGYVDLAFKELGVDAITLTPYLGKLSLMPFLEHENKGFFILCRTSNDGADEFQNFSHESSYPLYKNVAYRVCNYWNENKNCGLVVGATAPKELQEVTKIIKGNMPILIPGVGAQGGDLETSIKMAKYNGKLNAIINSSRGVIFKSSGHDFAKAAADEVRSLNSKVKKALKEIEED